MWHKVLPGEQLVSISSRPSKLKSSPKYLCGEIFLRLSSGRTIESTGDYGRATGAHLACSSCTWLLAAVPKSPLLPTAALPACVQSAATRRRDDSQRANSTLSCTAPLLT